MPTVLRKHGFRFFFYSNEGNEPPHIHVTGKGGEMKVWLDGLVVEFSYRVSPSEQRIIMQVIRENADYLLEKWNEFAGERG